MDQDEKDGWDEAICPQDGDPDNPSTMIIDDEIKDRIKQLATKCDNIIIIFDSCNSGTGSLAVGDGNPRWKEFRNPGYPVTGIPASAKDMELGDNPTDHILLAACLPDQIAKMTENVDGKSPGKWSSIFTTHLVNVATRVAKNADSALSAENF